MAKKKQTKTRTVYTTRWSGVDLLAFLALAASAILLLVGKILGWIIKELRGGIVLQVLGMVAQYCLHAAIAIPGWYYVRNKSTGWRIAYFVFLAIYVAAHILGLAVGV